MDLFTALRGAKREPMTREKKQRIRMMVYRTSWSTSIATLGLVCVLEAAMLVYTLIFPGIYRDYLGQYRSYYAALLVIALLYIGIYVYVSRDLEHRHGTLDLFNPVCAAAAFVWALLVTYTDALRSSRMDPMIFMTFSLAVPLGFYVTPGIYTVIVVAADAVMYLIESSFVLRSTPPVNLIIFFLFQIFLSYSFLWLKLRLAERLLAEQENAVTDVLTGLANRRRYEEDIARLGPTIRTFVSLDLNGLKTENDTNGHDSGDKLITGAARCMEQGLGSLGRLYRVGGDEFMALLEAEREETERGLRAMEEAAAAWTRENGIELSISSGLACAGEEPGLSPEELVSLADDRMYAAKEVYYRSHQRGR